MKRALLLCTLLGLLAVTAILGRGVPALWASPELPVQPLFNARTGEPLTLDAVVQDLAWHRETARKLQRLD
jgi:hypothetical protein